MDKIILVLQDKETIKELVKDENVQIKIKDAIIDGIAKRIAKGNTGVNISLTEAVTKAMRYEIFSDGYRTLKPSTEVEIKKVCSDLLKELNKNAKDDLSQEFNTFMESIKKEYKNYITYAAGIYKEKIDNADIEGMVKDFLEKKIKDVLSK